MDSDDEIEETPEYRGVPATIILINVFDPLHLKTAQVAHSATCRLLRQYLRESSSQYVGVSLFGLEVTNASMLGAKSVLDVFPLTQPTLDDYKKLQNVNLSSLEQEKELSMSEVLLHCSKIFANCKKQLSSRTIIILSRLDSPPIQADQKPTLKRVVDLTDSNVDLKLINIAETEYTINPFYHDFLANIRKDVILPKPIWDIKEIEMVMYKQSHRHLAVAKLNFEIREGINIGVSVYNLLKSVSYGKSTFLDRDTNAPLTSVTKTMKVTAEDSIEMDIDGEEQAPKQVPLLKSELIHYQEYGGERIEFTDTDFKLLKNPFGPPMLKLLGFKPATLIQKEKWFLKKCHFLFPNEGTIEGSTVAFKALHQACIETGMVAFCVLCTRVNSRPFNVVLSPCTNPLGLDIDVGFDIMCLPFVENVRDIPPDEDDDVIISEAHKTVMKDIIKTINVDYKPEMFENPKLQSQYRALEAIALDDEDIEPFIDTTKPSSDKFEDVKDDLFQQIFGPFAAVPVKRTGAKDESISSKRARMAEIDESLIESRIANNQVAKYTVADLKDILKSKDIPSLPALTGLKKADLVNLVIKHFK